MLSKVAERVYWIGRYIERVESTARLVSIYDKLLFDLPRSVELGWYNLILINNLEQDFNERYSVKDERNVVKFLLGDDTNSSSALTSLNAVRENVRTTRDVVLEPTWELVNELHLYVNDNIQQGINRRQRHEFLDHITKACQQIVGMLYGSMPRDAAWQFLCLGRNLECADMTTRILDAGAAAYLEMADNDNAVNCRQIILGHVLRSLNADQAYRSQMRSTVNADAVIEFLLENQEFPRSIAFCHQELHDSAAKLPRSEKVIKKLTSARRKYLSDLDFQELNVELRDYLNDMQIVHAKLHETISATWFPEWN